VNEPSYLPGQQRAPYGRVPHGTVRSDLAPHPGGPSNLADILERVLDKGIVIAGDIQINLLDIELLTIKLRLLVASVDRAKEMGINWWESDPTLTRDAGELAQENEELRARLDRLEQTLALTPGDSSEEGPRKARRTVTETRAQMDPKRSKVVSASKRKAVTEEFNDEPK
jgi:Gas vesicle protein